MLTNAVYMKKNLLLFFILLSTQSVIGQNKSYRNYNYKWLDANPVRLDVNKQYAEEPAVILEEKTRMELLEDKFYNNYRFNYLIEKKIRIRYQSKEGIAQFSKFSLPEDFDPQSSYYGLTLKQHQVMHRPKGDYDMVDYFVARIIKPDGTVKSAIITDSAEVEEFSVYPTERNYQTSKPRLTKHYAVHFTIKNIEVNDEVEINYSVRHVFLPSRFFFNGVLPKQKLDFTLKTDNRGHIYFVNQSNGASFKDSLNIGNHITYRWYLSNLAGCINEKGGRPYHELPYFAIHLNEMNYGVLDEKGSLLQALPYTWGTAMMDFVGYEHPIPKDVVYNDLAKVNVELMKWINQKTTAIADTNRALKAKVLHEDVVDNFKYQKDDAYFRNEDNENENLAKFIQNRTLREISRVRFYTRYMEKIKATYYKVLLLDKRVEEMVFEKFQIPVTYKIGFCIPYKSNPIILFPKLDRYGWYDNELPFYYEDIATSLVPQNLPADEAFKQLPKVTFINIRTPNSAISDNQRVTNVMASFHPDTGIVHFESKVDLKGQFSTMTRGSYLYNYIDATSNPLYHQLVWQVQDDVKKPEIKITTQEKKYPFDFAFLTNYKSRKILLKGKTESYFLSLKNWFPHLTESGLGGEHRQLSFFTDFTGRDSYRYYIKCGKPVNLANALSFEKNIDNNAGSYLCRISQPQADVIMIESTLLIKKEKVKPDEVKGLEEIYEAARNLNIGLLELKFEE